MNRRSFFTLLGKLAVAGAVAPLVPPVPAVYTRRIWRSSIAPGGVLVSTLHEEFARYRRDDEARYLRLKAKLLKFEARLREVELSLS